MTECSSIKLDKCGGLTGGLAIAGHARRMSAMFGSMLCTPSAMAPAFIAGQLCTVFDLDGPVFLKKVREPSVLCHSGHITCPETL